MSCICVLGMHRSGTSCLTGIMQKFAVELGEVFTENLYNKRGNRENERIVTLNDAVLAANNASWYQPVVVSEWSKAQEAERDEIVAQLSAAASGFWGFKDTRTLFTLPFWLDAIGEPLYIGTFRHPHRVALSLNSRDGAPIDQCWELWHVYNKRLLELARRKNFALVDFDLPAEEYLEDTLDKLVLLGLSPELVASGREFFDSGLRNQAARPVDNVALPEHVTALYNELLDYHRNFR